MNIGSLVKLVFDAHRPIDQNNLVGVVLKIDQINWDRLIHVGWSNGIVGQFSAFSKSLEIIEL